MKSRETFEWLVLGLVITAAAAVVPAYGAGIFWSSLSPIQRLWINHHVGSANLDALFALAFGVMIVLPAPVRAGLVEPRLRHVWPRVLVICGGCVAITVVFAPKLNMPQLRGSDHGYWMWLIGPPAEDLVFAGFLFGKLDSLWPRPIARWFPVRPAVFVTAIYFSLWHAQNFQSMDAVFVRQQMLYTFAGGVILGLTRQWTGSILFITLTHIATNFIAWRS